ncbi:MAG: hypothetical protein U9N35_02555 [Euryarchaeota archaeon]|nr:hypothetical protein [Euryarchaeota archaeon]
MSNSDEKDHKDWAIYILVIVGLLLLVLSILYVINTEGPVETSPPTTPSTTTPPKTEPSPPSTTPSIPTTTPPKTEPSPPSTTPPTTTPPETPSKIKWVKKEIAAELGEYVSDDRISVKVLRIYESTETATTAVEVLFKNETESPQVFNLKNISFFYYKSKEEYIKENFQWADLDEYSFEIGCLEFRSIKELNSCVKEIPPKNGLILLFHFNRRRWQPDHITFESYYYDDLEYTEWNIKVRG